METDVQGWDEPKKPFKPGKSSTVTITNQRATKDTGKPSAKTPNLTPTKVKNAIKDASLYIGDLTGCEETWKFTNEELEKLAGPSATVYNQLPDKFKVFHSEATGHFALALSVLMLANAVRSVVVPKVQETIAQRAFNKMTPDEQNELLKQSMAMANGTFMGDISSFLQG